MPRARHGAARAGAALLAATMIVVGLGGCATNSDGATANAGPTSGDGAAANAGATSGDRATANAGPTTPSHGAPSTPAAAPTPGPPMPSVTAPPFHGAVSKITAVDVRYTWRNGCPVGPARLRKLRMTYWGFDHRPHTGMMIVNERVVGDVLKIFKKLYDERFPVRSMEPEDAYGGSDPKSMAADNTSGFNCRYAVAPGPRSWSVHAYGEAIDVNTVENPYLEGGTVMPAGGGAYVDRSKYRPGMAVNGGVLVKAFASAGWKWGGRWTTTPDYQHFSQTGG